MEYHSGLSLVLHLLQPHGTDPGCAVKLKLVDVLPLTADHVLLPPGECGLVTEPCPPHHLPAGVRGHALHRAPHAHAVSTQEDNQLHLHLPHHVRAQLVQWAVPVHPVGHCAGPHQWDVRVGAIQLTSNCNFLKLKIKIIFEDQDSLSLCPIVHVTIEDVSNPEDQVEGPIPLGDQGIGAETDSMLVGLLAKPGEEDAKENSAKECGPENAKENQKNTIRTLCHGVPGAISNCLGCLKGQKDGTGDIVNIMEADSFCHLFFSMVILVKMTMIFL